ncbi:protease FtsH-inhibitory lysogeny factor CIII [Escherichia coli]|nr:protease FtsH-inhibitory lysogeny factor CIII [Escherichia coli]
MQLAVAGWPIAGCPESQLSRRVRQIIDAAVKQWRSLCK